MTATRRLAAILAADVAGYSRLIGADEEGTLNRLGRSEQRLSIRKSPNIEAASSKRPVMAWSNSPVSLMRCGVRRDG
jgi:hypothetical protein